MDELTIPHPPAQTALAPEPLRRMNAANTKAKKTAVGRGERAPERRKQEFLDAARKEFAEKGYGGASINDIAAHTDSNKALVYNYFGSKEGLYVAVLESMYADIRHKEQALQLEEMEPEDALQKLVAFTFEYYIANPEFIAILNGENMLGGRFIKQSAFAPTLNSTIVDTLSRILQRGVASGVFRDGIDPVDLYLSITGLGYTYVSNRHTLGIVFGRDLMKRNALKQRLANISEMVTRYVAVGG
ncbi:TetR/AcrR family transcriptional regulator [Pararobbsia alpina]|uniref:HTH-type transcriptional repressor NicS n=1 Tax=Pararobbsia alpina TaxID=621374 RepID=A0A6S7CRQ6_9BURK|nr:TetR/AcrR family transcriptional regulator [Pararobbsia alpina]CAB3796244.1 HTH-type transcriptional repressor NicS [Pararobbsia alpina]